jgi:hypothetical protein
VLFKLQVRLTGEPIAMGIVNWELVSIGVLFNRTDVMTGTIY